MTLATTTLASLLAALPLTRQEPESTPQAGVPSADEAAYYSVDHLTPPDGAVLEVGGMAFLPDGRLALSTRRGQVWLVENALAEDPADARFHLYAEGLHEGLGLAVKDGELYLVQRSELSRLRDTDGDDRVDTIDTICNGWGVSGNYHEFAFGLPVDREGNFYVSLNVSFFSPQWWHGKSTVPWRGWLLRISPEGEMTPVASGLRSPCGLGMDTEGRLFVTDNQGDWVASSPIYHIEEGRFYGHPASLRWTPSYRASGTEPSDTYPPPRAANDRTDPAIWIPYAWSRSTGNLVPDTTGGRFGPFEDQLFVAELTNGMVLRAHVEEVQGVVQGAILPHRQRIGSVARVLFAPDGTLFCGLTNRGWGGLAPADGLARVRWTGVEPMEMERISLRDHGFLVRFTGPLAADLALDPSAVEAISYDYDYWWEYGSPERDTRPLAVEALLPSSDRRELLVLTEPLEPGRVVRMRLGGLRAEDGRPLVHEEFAYTIRQLPSGPWHDGNVSKLVPPPPGRESDEEGWLRLTYGDATDLWSAAGWTLCDAEPDIGDPRTFRTREGNGALVNDPAAATPLTSEVELGDCVVETEFMLPQGGKGVLWIAGRYGIEFADAPELGARSVGVVLTPAGRIEPGFGAYRGHGQWHELQVRYRAPRFDAEGRKVEDARLEQVLVDGTLLHEDVSLPGASGGAPMKAEAARGPLAFAGGSGLYALRGVRAKPLDIPAWPTGDGDGWTRLLAGDEEGLEGWQQTGEAIWVLEDGVLTGEGPTGHLFSPRGDHGDHEVRARIKISDGGNSGLYVRAALGEGWPAGYEAQINSSYPDPQKTGSLYNLAPVRTHLIAPDTWFDHHVRCVDEEGGTRVTIRVNGIVTADFLDTERRHGPGHVVFQQHHDGSVIEVKDVFVRDL